MSEDQKGVSFSVVVQDDGAVYGATLYVDVGSDEDSVPCWRTAFVSTPGQSVDAVAEIYADCHLEAMDQIGCEGEMSPEEFVEKMRDSVVLTGEMMSRYGFRAVPYNEVGQERAQRIFEGLEGWPEEKSAEEIRKLN